MRNSELVAFKTASVLVLFHLYSGIMAQHLRHDVTLNDRPIIGIVAQDTDPPHLHGKTYIPGTYVTYVLQAGARVVPIRGDQPMEYYDRMVNMTNGILLPGGDVDFTTSIFSRSARRIFEKAVQINKKGDYYPIWGTCMGFQILCDFATGVNYDEPTDSFDYSWPLNFTKDAVSSRMFGKMPSDLKRALAREPLTHNQHHYSILVDTFKTTKLSSFFKALSTNVDNKGTEFVSSIEAKAYPFYGVQWHPEKGNLNWNTEFHINHSYHAVRVSQYMANFFVREARKSSHRFPDIGSEGKHLIQNYKQIYKGAGTFFADYIIDL